MSQRTSQWLKYMPPSKQTAEIAQRAAQQRRGQQQQQQQQQLQQVEETEPEEVVVVRLMCHPLADRRDCSESGAAEA